MALSNFERMIQLAEETFDSRNDPQQLNVDEKVIARLKKIHYATVTEFDEGNGPVVWILLIPTTAELMEKFVQKDISELELFEQTPLHINYDALYLCSAMVLEEFRKKGLALQLTLSAIDHIRKEHPINALFVWAFSKEGERLAEKISLLTGLVLRKR